MNITNLWNNNKDLIQDNKIIFNTPVSVKKDGIQYDILKLVKKEDGTVFADVRKQECVGFLNSSLYGTPEENLTQKMSDSLKRDFGRVEGVTDHNYVTNSYHINPAQPIDAFNKIKIEAKMMDKSTGGSVSYIELPNIDTNVKVVEDLIQFMYDNILYCEINVKRDLCYLCGYKGVIQLVKQDGKLVWECPSCKNKDASKMHIRRRVCGYIGDAATGVCQARLADYEARVEHLNQDHYEQF